MENNQEFNKQQEANRQAEAVSIAVLQNKQINMGDAISRIESMVVAFDTKLDKALEGKANKWVEKAVSGFVILLLTGFATYLGTLIYKATIHIQ